MAMGGNNLFDMRLLYAMRDMVLGNEIHRPQVAREIQVMDMLFCTACVILFPSLCLFISFASVSDVKILQESHTFSFIILLFVHISTLASSAILLLQSAETFRGHKQLVYILSFAATGVYIFFVVSLFLFRLMSFSTFSSSTDLTLRTTLFSFFACLLCEIPHNASNNLEEQPVGGIYTTDDSHCLCHLPRGTDTAVCCCS